MPTKRHRPQIRRWKELYLPTTYTFQIWLAVLAFSLSIFAYLYQFVARWWAMLGVELLDAFTTMPKYTPVSDLTFIDWIFGLFGFGALLLALFAFLSLICVVLRALIGVKIKGNKDKEEK